MGALLQPDGGVFSNVAAGIAIGTTAGAVLGTLVSMIHNRHVRVAGPSATSGLSEREAVSIASARIDRIYVGHVVGNLNIGTGGLALTPRQVPPVPGKFIDRLSEVRELDRILGIDSGTESPPIAIVAGTPGVGTSAVAFKWAHNAGSRFNDGHLYVNLADYRRGGGVAVSDVIVDLLKSLGFDDLSVPATLAQRTALFRSATADQRLLVVIDDANYAAEVTPLIPNSAAAAVLITSHRNMKDLVGAEGASVLQLGGLDPDAGRQLLAEMAGREPSAGEMEAMRQLVDMCDGLPLALRVCGALIGGGTGVVEVVSRLRDFGSGQPNLGVATQDRTAVVFDLAYRELDQNSGRAYRLLGLVPTTNTSLEALSALWSVSVESATLTASELVDRYLVERSEVNRVRVHGVVLLHAHKCVKEESEDVRQEAMRRLVGWYCQQANHADYSIIPDRTRIESTRREEVFGKLPFDGPASALDWFEIERANIAAVVEMSYHQGLFDSCWSLCQSLWLFYFNRKHYEDWIDTHRFGIMAAHSSGNVPAEARIRQQLGRAYTELKDFSLATTELDRALDLATESEHQGLVGSVLEFQGILANEMGRRDRAITLLELAREIYVGLEYQRAIAIQDHHLGRVYLAEGQVDAAIAHLTSGLAAIDPISDGITRVHILLTLGDAYRRGGRFDNAGATLNSALVGAKVLGLWHDEATAHESLGNLSVDQANLSEACRHLELAYGIYSTRRHSQAEKVKDQLVRLCPDST